MLHGYDIDGVLTKGVERKYPYVVISGRIFAEYDDFCKKLAQDAAVYIRGDGELGDRLAAGNFKAMMINHLNVTEFYEDDEFQATIIQKHCPKCNVVIVKL